MLCDLACWRVLVYCCSCLCVGCLLVRVCVLSCCYSIVSLLVYMGCVVFCVIVFFVVRVFFVYNGLACVRLGVVCLLICCCVFGFVCASFVSFVSRWTVLRYLRVCICCVCALKKRVCIAFACSFG